MFIRYTKNHPSRADGEIQALADHADIAPLLAAGHAVRCDARGNPLPAEPGDPAPPAVAASLDHLTPNARAYIARLDADIAAAAHATDSKRNS